MPLSRPSKIGVAIWIAVVLVVATGAGPPKKLIEFGWDEPDTAFLRRHVRTMEAMPFDGCVFHANVDEKDGKVANFAWLGWGRRTFSIDELKPAIDDLKATRFERFTDNFLRFNTTPADVDWFDDFAPILANARVAAKVALEGGCRGILFDVEQYQGKLFEYRKRPDALTKSWADCEARARLRGREVMAAFCRGYPGVTVLLTFGHSYPWKQSEAGKVPLLDCEYGLLAPFLDGMIDGIGPGARLVDAHELSYGYRDLEKFDLARRTILEGVLPIVGRPEAYRKAVSVGFGLWLDYDWPKYGWDESDPSRNYFTPGAFEASTRKALELADEYVWIYTEKPRWWTDKGPPTSLPVPYLEAIRKARKGQARD
jgi:hypothetical protein